MVLSTFTHYNTDVYALRVEDSEEVLYPTGRHPLFSVTRGDWVAVNELAEGDLLQTRSGPKKISSLGRKPGMHRVYNLEVEGEHCYFVGRAAVLGHNAKLCTEGAQEIVGKSLPGKGGDWVKLRGNQGWKDADGNIWKKDQIHKDHWDISDRNGNKIREVDFNGVQIWPGGPKNKNK